MKVVIKHRVSKTCRECGVSEADAKFYNNRRVCANCYIDTVRKSKKCVLKQPMIEPDTSGILDMQSCKTLEELECLKQAYEHAYHERKVAIYNEKVAEFDVIDSTLEIADVRSELMLYLTQVLKYENKSFDVRILELEGDPYDRNWTRVKFVGIENFTVRHKIEFMNILYGKIPAASKTNKIELPFNEDDLASKAKNILLRHISDLYDEVDMKFVSIRMEKNRTVIEWDPKYSIRKIGITRLQEYIIDELIKL
jgi:hypothetical protein